MQNDAFELSLVVGFAAGVICVGCFVYFASQSTASQNIALAASALVGAMALLGLQLFFELQDSESSDFFTAEYTVDRATPAVQKLRYDHANVSRWGLETEASKIFAAENPGQFDGDRQRLISQMAVFSLLAYVGTEQFDWQVKRVEFKTRDSTMVTHGFQSKSHECTNFSKEQIRTLLAKAGSPFANAKAFFVTHLCLPPNSEIEIAWNALTLKNPFCTISFSTESSGATSFNPGGGMEVPQLANKEGRFETSPVGIRSIVLCRGIRMQHHEMKKYRAWAERVARGAQDWFAEKGEDRPLRP